LAGKSDHVPSLAVIKVLSGPKRRWKKKKKHIGWKTELDDDGCARTFHTRLNDKLRNSPALDVEGVTRAIVAAASETAQITEARCGRRHPQEVQALFDERRAEQNPDRRTKLSKDLWRALRRELRDKHALQLHEIAEKGGGLRHLCKLSRESRRRVTAAINYEGELHTKTEDICEVFGAFYENLYKGSDGELAGCLSELPRGESTPVIQGEVMEALKTMKNNKTAAEDGLVAEMLKAGGGTLMETLAVIQLKEACGLSPPPPRFWA
jgi:hypothetical protein